MDVLQTGYISALVGDQDYTSATDTPYAQLYTITSVTVHPNYVDTTTGFDIAIYGTSTDIVYSRGVAPACIPWNYQNTAFPGYKVDVTGWGSTTFGGPPSTTLRKVTLDVITNAACSAQTSRNILSTQMCTFTQGKDTCQNDSGSGLYLRYTRMWLVGIVSYGAACYGQVPSVNTQVTSYLNWISQNTPNAIYCNKNIA